MILFSSVVAGASSVYVVVSPTRGGSSNNLDVLGTIDASSARITKLGNLTALGNVVPSCFGVIPASNSAVICSFQISTGFCLTEISLTTARTQHSSCFRGLEIVSRCVVVVVCVCVGG